MEKEFDKYWKENPITSESQPQTLLDFFKEIARKAFEAGYDSGYDIGYDNGKDDAEES